MLHAHAFHCLNIYAEIWNQVLIYMMGLQYYPSTPSDLDKIICKLKFKSILI